MKIGRFPQFGLLAAAMLFTPSLSTLRAADAPLAPELQVADQFYLAIPKTGFGKDYLFSASEIPQIQSPTSHGLASKIVQFQEFPDGVDMYESPKGLVVTEDLPARRLLATFPIVRQDASVVVVDFNKGMRRLFTESWTEGGPLNFEAHDDVLEVPQSRVFEMHADSGQIIIRQSIQARSRENNPDVEARYEVRYFISPWQPGNFQGKEPGMVDPRYTKFFESEGRLETGTGRMSSRIDRFDLKQPVVFYYSANTPPEYVEAVKDGILYWNTVFGKEVVQAKKAADGLTAPDAKCNIVQWVPWDRAGFAYADLLADPMSGESMHGQAYITSAFSYIGRARARALLRAMQETAETKDVKKTPAQLGLPFPSSGVCCEMDPRAFAQQMALGLQELLASDQLTDEAVLRTSQDYVREVVAHEVGHILGLRHNFAGSLGATLTAKELDDWFKAYLTGKPLDAYTNKLATTSMMEYTIFKGAVFTGWWMRTGKQPLPHDRGAIRWGYFDSEEARTNKMLFASDEDTERYADVRTFDYGPEPVVGDYNDVAEYIDLLPNNIIEMFIAARAPQNTNDRVPLKQVNLNYTLAANQIANQFANALVWFKADTRSLRVENQFDFVGELNLKERHQAHWQFLNRQIDELGGVDRALFSPLPPDFKLDLKDEPGGMRIVQRLNATNLSAKLEHLLASTNYITFVGLDDKKYTFTPDERALILERGKEYFGKLEDEYVKQLCKRLEDAPRDLGSEANDTIAEDDITAKLEHRIIELAKQVITAQVDTNRLSGKVDKSYVEVPVYKYDQETRVAAAKALNEKTGSYKSWADDAKNELNTQLKKQVEDAMNISHFKDFQVSMLSRPLRD
ncbi:MAG TPA: zinc-dependent metalloprotease, partial [Candidatus Acidoferrales bacterium]|nr:zinc-dependent metalloprotease [Candidatus Acidoferrales bacterium]